MKKLIKAKGVFADWQDNALLALEAMGFKRLTYNIIRTDFTGEKDGVAFCLKIEAADDGKVALHLDGDDASIENFKKLAAAAFQLKAQNAQKTDNVNKEANKPAEKSEEQPANHQEKDGLPTSDAPVDGANEKTDNQEKPDTKSEKFEDNKPEAANTALTAKQDKKPVKAKKAKKQKRGLTFGWGLLIFIIVLFGAMALYGWHVGLFDKMMHRGQTIKKKVVR